MFTRDYILRQVQQLIQALSLVLVHKRAGSAEQAADMLGEALGAITGLSLDRIRGLDRSALLELCTRDGRFQPDFAVAVADLLREDDRAASHARARFLYETALQSGGAMPLDIQERIAELPRLAE
jgi:hypothetical protein